MRYVKCKCMPEPGAETQIRPGRLEPSGPYPSSLRRGLAALPPLFLCLPLFYHPLSLSPLSARPGPLELLLYAGDEFLDVAGLHAARVVVAHGFVLLEGFLQVAEFFIDQARFPQIDGSGGEVVAVGGGAFVVFHAFFEPAQFDVGVACQSDILGGDQGAGGVVRHGVIGLESVDGLLVFAQVEVAQTGVMIGQISLRGIAVFIGDGLETVERGIAVQSQGERVAFELVLEIGRASCRERV